MTRLEYFGDYALRQAVPADLPTLVELERTCQPDAWPLERIEAFLTTPHDGCEQFGTMAFFSEKVVGYALLTTGGGNMAIDRVGVLSVHRRKRVGTKLIAMAILEGRARNLEFMVTVLRESNVGAQHLFYACGFRAGKMAGPLKGWFGTERVFGWAASWGAAG